jgi:hypothetical protein
VRLQTTRQVFDVPRDKLSVIRITKSMAADHNIESCVRARAAEVGNREMAAGPSPLLRVYHTSTLSVVVSFGAIRV